jgi:hypothetical protein
MARGTSRSMVRERLADEGGAVVVLFALILTVLFGAVAFTVDLSRLFHERQVLQNAVDFGALAGAQDMPVQGSAQASIAAAEALRVTLDNAPDLTATAVAINFRCLVGDRNGDGAPDLEDVPYVCGPVTGTWAAGEWRTRRARSSHACNPYAGDKCNTIVVQTSEVVDYAFAPVIGIDQGSTGAVNAASCKGSCGAARSPLDVVIVFDRTASMTPADLANAKNGALSVLDFYQSSQQYVGLVGLPYHNPANPCLVRSTQTYPNVGNAWRLVGLSSDYDRADGTPNPASRLIQMINCLQLPPSGMSVTPSGAGHTDLGDPMQTAASMLSTEGRSTVPDVVIFFTDGEANQPRFNQPCTYATTRAAAAKAAGVEVFTIAYGVAGARCTQDTAGTYRNAWATTFLSAMATDSIDDAPGGCGINENKDGDHYFCESGSGDLEPVFRQVAAASVGNARLVDDV